MSSIFCECSVCPNGMAESYIMTPGGFTPNGTCSMCVTLTSTFTFTNTGAGCTMTLPLAPAVGCCYTGWT
ncbi:MAG TPA: hypothetical protein VND64_18045, partial [Pirellulales bacterium]|nr:hypothetical protein [Pirellulales bacterium]